MEYDELFSKENESSAVDNFPVEELLNFSDDACGDDVTDVTEVAHDENSNSSFSGVKGQFSGDIGCRSMVLVEPLTADNICVPDEDVAELEWLSNFVDDSFSADELHNLNLISGTKPPSEAGSETHGSNSGPDPDPSHYQTDLSIRAKARSKRPRAAPLSWDSRLSLVSPVSPKKKPKKREAVEGGFSVSKRETVDGAVSLRCLHCDTDQTPQWRTGPMGPKTLCNACGVRYKSGRLVPEYRPAASPTFVVAKHSNSHRKVLELRRQKEVQLAQYQVFERAGFMGINGLEGEDMHLIHHHLGTDFRHLI